MKYEKVPPQLETYSVNGQTTVGDGAPDVPEYWIKTYFVSVILRGGTSGRRPLPIYWPSCGRTLRESRENSAGTKQKSTINMMMLTAENGT